MFCAAMDYIRAELLDRFFGKNIVGNRKADLLGDRVWLEEFRKVKPSQIAKGPRIGIDYAEEWIDKPWRFWIRNNTYVSRR